MGRQLMIAAVALLLSGCIPAPNRRMVSPPIRGRLMEAGRPLTGARVSRCVSNWNCSCDAADEAVTTDSDGRFELPERHRWSVFYSPDDTVVPPVLLCYGSTTPRVLWQSGGTLPPTERVLLCAVGLHTRCEVSESR